VIHIPPLDAGYALTLVDIFERAIEAIWRAHGDRMRELGNLRAVAHLRRNSDYGDDENLEATTDLDVTDARKER
jgi:hypothetical protein